MGLKDAKLYLRYHAALTEAGFAVLIFDYRGFGESEGRTDLLRPQDQLEDLINAVSVFATTAALDIRNANLVSSAISVFIETNRFSNGPQYTPSQSVELSPATNKTKPIVRAAIQGLKEAYREGFKFKKAGVMLLDLVDADHAPQSLFDHHDPKDDKLIEAFDQINNRQGAGSINFGAAGQPSRWHSNSAHQSPRYTTEWGSVPVVKT